MKKLFVIPLVALMTLLLAGCDRNESKATKEVVATFNTMFPDAKFVEWDREDGYWVAEFRNGGREVEARFELSGVWYKTKTDILRSDLPASVETALSTGEYRDWRVDDLDKVERRETTTYFVLQLEKLTQERIIRYDVEGNLLP